MPLGGRETARGMMTTALDKLIIIFRHGVRILIFD